MPSGEYKAIAIKPVGILRVVPHHLVVQHVTHRSASHRQTGMAGIRLLDGVDCQETDRVDGFIDEIGVCGLADGFGGRGCADREAGDAGGSAAGGGGDGREDGFKAGEGGEGKRGGGSWMAGAMT